MIEFTPIQLAGLCVVLLLLGGTIAVYGLAFLNWNQARRDRALERAIDDAEPPAPIIPAQRTGRVNVRIVADTDSIRRDLNWSQRRADAIRDSHGRRYAAGGVVSRPSDDPPPEGMEDRVIERLHKLGDDMRTHESGTTPTDEGNTPDGR